MAFLGAGCRPKPEAVTPEVGYTASTRQAFEAAARATLPGAHEIIRIGWQSDDGRLQFSGAGAVRLAPPDSLRLDIAASLGIGRSIVLLMGERVEAQPEAVVDQLLPDRFALWAALGIMRAPPGVTGYEVAEDPARTLWRVTDAAGRATIYQMQGGQLMQVTREEGGRPVSQLRLTRTQAGALRRANLLDTTRGFRLQVDINAREPSEPFAPTVWRVRA